MAKVTLEQIECDICRKVGERYTLSFPDGIKVLDRCAAHAKKIFALKEEQGEWTPLHLNSNNGRGIGRAGVKVSTADDIIAQRKRKAGIAESRPA